MKRTLSALILTLLLGLSPALAQDGGTNTVVFNYFGFTLDPSLASNVSIAQVPGDSPDLAAPGGPQAAHTAFILTQDILSAGTPVPSLLDANVAILVFPVENFAPYDFYAMRREAMQELLLTRPNLNDYMTALSDAGNNELPFLPVFPAAQVIRARVQYVDGMDVSGVSYITFFSQGITPFTSDSFMYTFQGLTHDGTAYVSMIARLNTDLFPAQIPPDFNMDSFVAGMQQYNADSIATLNAASPDAFSPSLNTLDALVASFRVVK